MIWDTPGDGSVEQTKDTYIEIKEMISVDLTGLRQDIQDLQDASIEIYDRLAAADSSINENKIYFNGGTMPKGNATLNKFGNLPKGTTIAQLEAMTMSEILKKILYEVATATKTRDQSASISWKSYGTEQEVGANMPAVANVSIGYLSEQWKVITSSGDTFATYTLSKINNTNTDYFWNTTGQKSGGVSLKSPDYSNNKVGAGKNYVYVDVAYDGYQDALNSDGTLAQEKKSGNIIANNVLQFTGLWHMYSNATEYSQNSLYSLKNVNPEGGFKGNDAKEPLNGAFAKSGSKLYFQWPRDTTASQVFHIYVPYDLVPTGIWQASDSKDEVYDVSVPYTAGNTSVGILNSKNVMGRYRDYVLTKTPGITTVEVTLGNNA